MGHPGAVALGAALLLLPASLDARSRSEDEASTWSRHSLGVFVMVAPHNEVRWSGTVVDDGGAPVIDEERELGLRPAVSFGVFGEHRPVQRLAIGAELLFAVTGMTENRFRRRSTGAAAWESWESWRSCDSCQLELALWVMARLKVPIQPTRSIAVHPIASVGFFDYTSIFSNQRGIENWPGIGYGLGGGVEITLVPRVTPFVEARYLGGVGFGVRESHWFYYSTQMTGVYHAVAVTAGVRFL